jgi:hypothetical protein
MTVTETRAEVASEQIVPAAGITFAAGTMAGVTASAIGATPGHSAIVASLTAALTMAGEVTSRARRHAGEADNLLAVKSLHTLIGELRPLAIDLSDEWSRTLDIATDDLEMSFTLTLQSGHARAVSDAFAFVDRAWRLAGLIAKGDSDLLPSRGKVNLDKLMPFHVEGLVVIDAEAGSFTGTLRAHKAKLLHVAVAILINAPAVSGYSARDLSDLIHGDAVRQQQQCELGISGEIHQPLRKLIHRELGGLPIEDCQMTVNVTTPDGVRMHFTFADTDKP